MRIQHVLGVLTLLLIGGFLFVGKPASSADTGVIATVGTNTTENYQEQTTDGVIEQNQYIITDLGEPLSSTTGLYVYTPNEVQTACYSVAKNDGGPVTNLAATHRNGQSFITWTEATTATSYSVTRQNCVAAGANEVLVNETDDEPVPVLVRQVDQGRIYTMYMDQDNWNADVYQGQGYSFSLAFPEGYVSGTPIALTVHMEGRSSRFYFPTSTPFNFDTAYLRIDEPDLDPLSQGWYFGQPCTGTDIDVAQEVCNFLEHAILRAVSNTLRMHPALDEDRTYAYGHSMGGTGVLRLGIRYPEYFASVYASEPVTNFTTVADLGGDDWETDVADNWGSQPNNYPFRAIGLTRSSMSEFDGDGVYDVQNLNQWICDNRGRDTAQIGVAHGLQDDVVDTDTQGYPFYQAANSCLLGFQGGLQNLGHQWLGYYGQGINNNKERFGGSGGYGSTNSVGDMSNLAYTFTKQSFPAFSDASNSLTTTATNTVGLFNNDLEWSTSDNPENNFSGNIIDTADYYEIAIRSRSWNFGYQEGTTQTVKITPRRLQNFSVSTGETVTWENISLVNSSTVASGTLIVDAYGLATVNNFQVTPSGNKLILTKEGSVALGTHIVTTTVSNNTSVNRTSSPITWSIPLAQSAGVTSTDDLQLVQGSTIIPAQFTSLARWGGTPTNTANPLQVVLVDAQLDIDANTTNTYSIRQGSQGSVNTSLAIPTNNATQMVIETGAATFTISKANFGFFDQVELSNGTIYEGNGGIMYDGTMATGSASVVVEHQGAKRISVMATGTITGDFRYTARMHFYDGLPEAQIDFRVENLNDITVVGGQPNAANYGVTNTVQFGDLSLLFPATTTDEYMIPAGELGVGGVTTGTYANHLRLMQHSSGDDNWDVMVGYGERLQSGVTQRTSSIRIDDVTTDGPLQIAGWMSANGVSVAVEHAWQNFPKAFRAQSDQVEVGLFPGEFSRDHELRPGEFKTHKLWVRYHNLDNVDIENKAKTAFDRLRFLPSDNYLVSSRAYGLYGPRVEGQYANYELGVDGQIAFQPETDIDFNYTTQHIFEAISDAQNYGWVDYGSIPTDFENEFSPYGYKFDGLRGAVMQALRTNDERWWYLAHSGSQSSADVYIQHSKVDGFDRAWWEGGAYGHINHDENGQLNPHRNGGRPDPQVGSACAGVMLYGLMAGDTLALNSCLENADNMVFRSRESDYVDQGWNDIALSSGLTDCGGDGFCAGYVNSFFSRDAANLIKTLLWGYIYSGTAEYLDVIEDHNNFMNLYLTELTDGDNDRDGDLIHDRMHFTATYIRELAAYVQYRSDAGLGRDLNAEAILQTYEDFMTDTIWDDTRNIVMATIDSGNTNPEQGTVARNNWQLAMADALAGIALVQNDANLLHNFASSSFAYGAANPLEGGDGEGGGDPRFYETKEYVNQIGFGTTFIHAAAVLGAPTSSPTSAPPTISFSAGAATTTEAVGTYQFMVQLSATSSEAVAVAYSLVNASTTAVSGTDFVLAGTGTSTISAGSTTATISLAVTDDDTSESTEYVYLTLANPTNATLASPSTTRLAITDNDTPGVGPSVSSINITEGENGSYTIVLDSAPSTTVDITLLSSDNDRLSITTSTITFTTSTWNVSSTITLVANDNNDVESNQSVTVSYTVSSTDASYNEIAVDNLTVTILEDDRRRSGGGGGGGGGGSFRRPTISNSTSANTPPTIKSRVRTAEKQADVDGLTEDTTVAPRTRSVRARNPQAATVRLRQRFIRGSRTPVSVGGAIHAVTVEQATTNSIQAIIESDPINVTLDLGVTTTLDTDNDGIDDLQVAYLGLDDDGEPLLDLQNITDVLELEELGMTINAGAYTTTNTDVTITFSIEDAVTMSLSETETFATNSFVAYVPTITFSLSEGNAVKTIYVRFKAEDGSIFDTSDTIELVGQATDALPDVSRPPLDISCPLTIGNVYKSPVDSAVYYVTYPRNPDGTYIQEGTCTKRPFKKSQVYFTYFTSWDPVQTISVQSLAAVPDDALGFMPLGPRYRPSFGALVKAVSDPRVYVLLDDKKFWIANADVFTALNYQWSWIEDVAEELLDSYTTGEEITRTDIHPEFTLIKYPNDSKVYQLRSEISSPNGLVKRWITSPEAFNRLNFRWDRIVIIDEAETYPDGEDLR